MALQSAEYDRLRDRMAHETPENVALFGHKLYSQHDEDGIITEIFNRIKGSKSFIEIGIQDGTECNSVALLLTGWKGCWIEGDSNYVQGIGRELGSTEFAGKLKVLNSFVDRNNIVALCRSCNSFLSVDNVDFFSLDIDGNDYYIVEEMLKGGIRPSVFCVEYNGRFPLGMHIKIKYNRTHIWDKTEYMGASLQAFIDLFSQHGYTLVCCNLIGINAFFVKDELASAFPKYTADQLYQPARYFLSPMIHGHPASLRFLRDHVQVSS
jgi:hypothetical protein